MRSAKRAFRLGLTGGIASGKSEALREFARLGAEAVDCDALAREALEPGRPAHRAALRRFGRRIAGKDGRIDREALARLVFADPAKRRALERLVHPEVQRGMRRAMRAAKAPVVVADVPLLFEAGLEGEFDATLAVRSPREARLRRLARRGMSRARALSRMRAQLSDEERCARADLTVDNASALKDFKRRIREAHGALSLIAGTRRHKR